MASTHLDGSDIVYHGLRIPLEEILNMCRDESNSDRILMILGADTDTCEHCERIKYPTSRSNILVTFFPYIDFETADQLLPPDPNGSAYIGIIELSTVCDNHRGHYTGDNSVNEPDFCLAECDSYSCDIRQLYDELDNQNTIVIDSILANLIRGIIDHA